jgi:phage host-nuclease inhibitor protein Gam
MRQQLIDTAKEFSELQDEVEEIRKQIADLQRDTFGVESEETEKKARQLFTEVGATEDGADVSDQIDELRDERKDFEKKVESVRSELLEQVTDIRFPLDGTIENRDGEVVFPYSEEIEDDVLEAVENVLAEDFSKNGVTINTEAIIVETDSTDEAIDAVERRVTGIRQTAEAQDDAADQAESVHERDPKVAGMMFTLRQAGESMTKSELEKRMGLESGDLRGQLYYVVENDPYLHKPDEKVELTSTGEIVIDEFIERLGEPIWDKSDNENEEVEA